MDCRCGLQRPMMVSTSSAKPMSSIRSASSRTRISRSPRSTSSAVQVLQQPAWGGDQDLRVLAQGRDLVGLGLAPGDDPGGEAREAPQAHELDVDLAGQLAGGDQDQGAGGAGAGAVVHEALHHGQQEGGGLAGPGGGGDQQVRAVHGQRDHLLLDRGGGLVALLDQAAVELVGEEEVGKL